MQIIQIINMDFMDRRIFVYYVPCSLLKVVLRTTFDTKSQTYRRQIHSKAILNVSKFNISIERIQTRVWPQRTERTFVSAHFHNILEKIRLILTNL